MKIDMLLVRPGAAGAGGRPDRAAALAAGLKARGQQPAVLSLVSEPGTPDGVPYFCLDYPSRILSGERWGPGAAHAHGVRNFRDFAFCQYQYIQTEVRPRPYEVLMAEVPAAFAEVQKFFSEHDVRHVVHPHMGGEIIRRVVSRVAAAKGIPVLYEGGTRYFPDRVLLVTDELGTLAARPNLRFAHLPDAKQTYLREFLESRRSRKPVAAYGNPTRRFLPLLKQFVLEGKFMDGRRLLKGLDTARRFLAYEAGKAYWRPLDPSRPFVFYPLHFVVESNIILRSPACFQQEAVIEYIARVLPEGLDLCLKQHPHYRAEGVTLSVIRRLLQLGNVRMLPAPANSWDILRAARGVITIHGTAGFEAVLLRKPAVVLGYPPYRGWGVTHDIANLDSLPRALDEALHSELSEEQVLDFLASFESVHSPGDWYGEPLDPDRMADAVVTAFGR